jgi:dTDP-glucose pyrophosphorylase
MYSLILAGSNSSFNSPNFELRNLESQIETLSRHTNVIILTSSRSTISILEKYSQVECLMIPDNTAGALASASYGLSKIPSGESFLVVPTNASIEKNGISNFQREMHASASEVGAMVFQGSEPIYSYARLDERGAIIEIVEKQISGSCALAGVYYFKNASLFENCVEWAMVNNVSHEGKFYLSPALNYFLANSIPISLFEISSQDYLRY